MKPEVKPEPMATHINLPQMIRKREPAVPYVYKIPYFENPESIRALCQKKYRSVLETANLLRTLTTFRKRVKLGFSLVKLPKFPSNRGFCKRMRRVLSAMGNPELLLSVQ